MTNIGKLLEQLAREEQQLRSTQFLAPCVKGGRVRTRVGGMVCTFAPQPRQFEGWGIFQVQTARIAALVEEADVFQVAEYLERFPRFRLRLAYRLRGQTWLAYPVSEADVRQRISGGVRPIPVHLVTEGSAFEVIAARFDGQAWWFDQIDRRADPEVADLLKAQLTQLTEIEALRFPGITPEMRVAYDLVSQQTEGFSPFHRDGRRLKDALQVGGGELQQFQDRGEYWMVEWTTAEGDRHTSAIAKNDLTVISSGICLSGRDRDFDLQSLVGVMENRD
ncbi:MAG TPA: hypothetical protein IGS17_16730 [Oscillatoriales cyanobacterium M59_W2019_021]|nr:hypothetical protein [Oscillatoriales cyanobacterium M4454_W2019_049]HIK52551.1 hypothetical protein [Oscillatoriales cyanobacterium M59_W2019_021]